MKIAILDAKVLDPGDIDWTPITSLGDVAIYDATAPEQIADRAKGADVVIVNKVRLHGQGFADIGPETGLICMLATGYDNVNVAGFAERGVPVCNVVAYGVDDVAQHTMALLLELCRNVGAQSEDVRKGSWCKGPWCYWLKTPVVLRGLTMGIIGFGTIGRRTGELAHAFGMNVLGCSRSRKNPLPLERFAFATQEEIFEKADVISLHCPLTDETRHLVRAETIARMKDGVYILNAARGPLLKEDDCAEALKSGKIAGIGCDVLSSESPAEDNPLLAAPNCIITPHMAWASLDSRQRIVDMTADNIRAWQKGAPQSVVNAPKA